MENKIFKYVNKVFEKVMTIAFIVIILMGLYITADVLYVFKSVSADTISRFKPDQITEETLREFSDEAVAWVIIDDTTIDYPIMQAEDNVKYLNMDPQGNYSLAGSLFMDFRNAADFSDSYNLVYGHHMTGGMMLGALDDFRDPEFYETHRTGTLNTRTTEYPFKVISYVITTTDCQEIFNPENETDFRTFLKENAEYYFEEDMTDHILALTTCKDPATTDRAALIVALCDDEARPNTTIEAAEEESGENDEQQ